jgi:nucleotide-binding universal stress UspA family protein
MARSGPIVIGYDGSPAAQHALREAGELFAGRPAFVIVVWRAGLGFELAEPTAAMVGVPPVTVDVRTALDIDAELRARAEELARQGARLAREAGFDASGHVVAEDLDTEVHEVIVHEARERDAQAIVVGAHDQGALAEIILGSTARAVVRHAPCPVVVVREQS